MVIGTAVEFCIHLTMAFMRTKGSRDYRVARALVSASSVVSDITLTELELALVVRGKCVALLRRNMSSSCASTRRAST